MARLHAELEPAQHWLGIAVTIAAFGYLVSGYLRILLTKPRFERKEIIFQEWFASGCSHKNILTKIGGARNALRLVVTHKFLWVTSWFPFSLIASPYDLEHLIPLDSIVSLRSSTFLANQSFASPFSTITESNTP